MLHQTVFLFTFQRFEAALQLKGTGVEFYVFLLTLLFETFREGKKIEFLRI